RLMFRRLALLLLALILAISGALIPVGPTGAQLDDEVRDRVTAAAVGIVIETDVAIISGSGTVVSPSGLTLTNQHVIEDAERRGLLVWITISDGRSNPMRAYQAMVVRSDSALD